MDNYRVGDVIKLKWIIDEFKEVDEKMRVFFHRKADSYKMDFLVNGFIKLVDDPKEEYSVGDEVIISFTITRITDTQVQYKNYRITETRSIKSFLEMMEKNK